MKYTTDEALEEIYRRGEQIRDRHERRMTSILSAGSAVVGFLLVGLLSYYSGTGVDAVGQSYGSFLLFPDAGGYVLVAVIAFILGVLITVAARRCRRHKDPAKEA